MRSVAVPVPSCCARTILLLVATFRGYNGRAERVSVSTLTLARRQDLDSRSGEEFISIASHACTYIAIYLHVFRLSILRLPLARCSRGLLLLLLLFRGAGRFAPAIGIPKMEFSKLIANWFIQDARVPVLSQEEPIVSGEPSPGSVRCGNIKINQWKRLAHSSGSR